MNMKKYAWAFASALTLMHLCGCSNEQGTDVAGQGGTIMINLAADLSYTRAIDESTYSDVNNYRVSLYKGETAIFQNQLYSDLELTQEVDFGETYTLTAFYGEDVAAGYDKLYVKGSETFSVAQGDTRMITLVCRPANAKFRVAYEGADANDSFEDYFQDCAVSIQTTFMDAPVTLTKADKDKELYLKTGDTGTTANLTLALTDRDGDPVQVSGFETGKSIKLKPGVAYTLTIKPHKVDVEGGQFDLEITVDDGVTEEDITVTIPGDYI